MKNIKINAQEIAVIGVFFLVLLFGSIFFLHGFGRHVVEKKTEKSPQTIQEMLYVQCGKDKSPDECYAKQFGALSKQYDMKFSLETLSALQDRDPAARNCHLIAHAISDEETAKDVTKWREILSQVDAVSCDGGFIHGVLETKENLEPTFNFGEKTISDVCSIVKQAESGNGLEESMGESSCVHIMGHMTLVVQDGDIAKAAHICIKLPSSRDQDQCLAGVFMESELRDNLAEHGLASHIPWNEQTIREQEHMCGIYSGNIGKECWLEISRMYAVVYHDNPEKIYAHCNRSPYKNGDCYNRAMGDLSISAGYAGENLKLICRSFASKKDFLHCIINVINHMMLTSIKFTDRAIYICDTTYADLRGACFGFLGGTLQHLAPADLPKFCNSFPFQYRNFCTNKPGQS